MPNLTTRALVRQQLGISSTQDDGLIDLYVEQAAAMIETHCNRIFGTFIEALRYDARESIIGGRIKGRMLFFDTDVLGVDSVVNGADGTLDSTDYRLLPSNPPSHRRTAPFPRYGIELLPSSGRRWARGELGDRENAIIVNGTIGYCLPSQVPPDVRLAATRLAAWLYQNRDNDGATIQMADGTLNMPAEAPSFVLNTIRRYVRFVFAS